MEIKNVVDHNGGSYRSMLEKENGKFYLCIGTNPDRAEHGTTVYEYPGETETVVSLFIHDPEELRSLSNFAKKYADEMESGLI